MPRRTPVIRINPEESVAVAARTLGRYNIGALPVCGSDGRLCGLITDRDIVTRCLAAGRSASSTPVRDVMTAKVITARPDMEVALAAGLMGREQIRRLPVMENGRLAEWSAWVTWHAGRNQHRRGRRSDGDQQ